MNDEKFYILDTRTVVGNCAMWWCPEGRNYTCEIKEAGVYSREDAFSKRETDVPIPVSLVVAMSMTHVRLDLLRSVIDIRGYEKTRKGTQRDAWWKKEKVRIAEFVATEREDVPEAVLCPHCNAQPIVCVGRYEGHGSVHGACDTCCGHGNEDGWCIHLDDHEEIIAAFERDRLFVERMQGEIDTVGSDPESFGTVVRRRIKHVIGRDPDTEEVIVGPFLVPHDHPLASDNPPAVAAILQAQVETMQSLLEEIRPLFAAFPSLATLVPRIDQAIHGPLTITFTPRPGLAEQIVDALTQLHDAPRSLLLRKVTEPLERGGA